jgi:hypothetical protein
LKDFHYIYGLSVIIPPQLQRPIFSGTMCLSVQNALETIDGEIIVIDNNSPDDSCNDGKAFSNVKLIRNQDVGFQKE